MMAVWVWVSLGFASTLGLLLITTHHIYIYIYVYNVKMCLLCPFYFTFFFFTLFMQVTEQKLPKFGNVGWRRFLLCYRLRKCSVHGIIKLAGKIPFSFLVSKCHPGKTMGNFPCILPSPLKADFYFCESFFFTCGRNLKYKLITHF